MSTIKLKAKHDLRLAAYGDLHGTYVSDPAVAMTGRLLEEFNPDVCVNLGDGVDAEAISSFRASLEQLGSLQADINSFVAAQTKLKAAAPKARHFYIRGNHCQRVEKLCDEVSGLSSLDVLKIDELFQLNNMGIELCDGVIVGKGQQQAVELVHGWVARKWPGASVREMATQRGLQSSMIVGHTHKLSYENRTTSTGSIGLIEAGWLGNVDDMRYMAGRTANWRNAVVFVTWTGKPLRPSFELVPIDVVGNRASAIYRGESFYV